MKNTLYVYVVVFVRDEEAATGLLECPPVQRQLRASQGPVQKGNSGLCSKNQENSFFLSSIVFLLMCLGVFAAVSFVSDI